ncbi:MAG: class I SAM-dependent methyltransferase [Rhizomicrobium sp.]
MAPPSSNPIADRRIDAVLQRLHRRATRQLPGLVVHLALEALKELVGGPRPVEAAYYRDKLIPIDRGQGWLIYTLCRAQQARRVVEFGTSYGVSTLYLAAAMRDQGAGLVIGTEIDAEKARHARSHFAEAGVADLIDLREGDALETLKDCGGPVDFLLVDGFPKLARPIIELMAPQLRKGAIVIADNVGHFPKTFVDYLDFVRRPANGFVSTLLPLRGGTEFSVKI